MMKKPAAVSIRRNYQMVRFDQLISPHENGNPGFNRGITGINRAKVNKIKREFDPNQVSPAIVSFRDGKYYIVDGQHTALAIYELNGEDGSTPIYCDVREGLTYEQEAQLFYDVNTNKRPVGTADKIWALVVARDKDAVEFKSIIEQSGYTFGRKTASAISPIGACWKIFNRQLGAERIKDILTLIRDTWPNDSAAVNVDTVHGIDLFLERHGQEYDRERFTKTLGSISYRTIVSDAKALHRSMSDKAYTMPVCAYMQIGKRYNNGLRSNRLRLIIPS